MHTNHLKYARHFYLFLKCLVFTQLMTIIRNDNFLFNGHCIILFNTNIYFVHQVHANVILK